MTLIADMLKAIADYSKNDRAEFIKTVQEAQATQQATDITKKKRRLAAAQKRAGELERLMCKIYEDNALGRLPDARYAALDAQYAKEQDELSGEIDGLEKVISGFEQSKKSAEKFIALVEKYENFDTMTTTMLNEFVEKILVHERARKGSIETTQEVEIYAPAAQMDASLYGRWRAADGTSITLDEYGGAQTSMELRPWWAIGKSTALSWEASNGQLRLITSYSAEYKYTYYPDTGEIGLRADELQVGSLFLHRVNGNTGDSMIGVWDDNDMGGLYFTFNADGTGAFANDISTTWVADDENVYIYYSLYGTYDYYVSGDTLELFFSDGSNLPAVREIFS